jgi:hypothetical protein
VLLGAGNLLCTLVQIWPRQLLTTKAHIIALILCLHEPSQVFSIDQDSQWHWICFHPLHDSSMLQAVFFFIVVYMMSTMYHPWDNSTCVAFSCHKEALK